jgi:hypothetical protein
VVQEDEVMIVIVRLREYEWKL